jgi:hypothetical protein
MQALPLLQELAGTNFDDACVIRDELPRQRLRSKHQGHQHRARKTLVWFLLLFACLQCLINVAMDRWLPALRDPEYACKLEILRARLAEDSERPLLLVLGSSRVGEGFQPGVMRPREANRPKPPLVFNFALVGSGPVMELVCLKRLLKAGIRPDRLLVEVLCPVLHQHMGWSEFSWIDMRHLSLGDVLVARPYSAHPGSLLWQWLGVRLAPCWSHRYYIMSRLAPSWVLWGTRHAGFDRFDAEGWQPNPRDRVTAEEGAWGTWLALQQYHGALDHFQISPAPDRALHDLLDLCRQEQLPVQLLLMPEGSEFHAAYGEEGQRIINTYLRLLAEEYGIEVLDTRRWMPDCAFADNHHLLPAGAAAFSERFGREKLGAGEGRKAANSLAAELRLAQPRSRNEGLECNHGQARGNRLPDAAR